MSTRPKEKPGLHNIECASCGRTVKSNQIRIGRETGLPFCLSHAIENPRRVVVVIPEAQVPHPQGDQDDQFISFDVDFTPVPLAY